jgi:hypothetical protein
LNKQGNQISDECSLAFYFGEGLTIIFINFMLDSIRSTKHFYLPVGSLKSATLSARMKPLNDPLNVYGRGKSFQFYWKDIILCVFP